MVGMEGEGIFEGKKDVHDAIFSICFCAAADEARTARAATAVEKCMVDLFVLFGWKRKQEMLIVSR